MYVTYHMDMFRVSQHHMREGHLLTQAQEEMLLIGGFGLFWLGTSGPVLVSRSVLRILPLPFSRSPSPSCPFACGPVVVKAVVTDLGGIGCSVHTSDPHFQPR